jgi:hypothetical protein
MIFGHKLFSPVSGILFLAFSSSMICLFYISNQKIEAEKNLQRVRVIEEYLLSDKLKADKEVNRISKSYELLVEENKILKDEIASLIVFKSRERNQIKLSSGSKKEKNSKKRNQSYAENSVRNFESVRASN